jgi:glycosyltransferase involved in cell wall biosynthesis
VNASNEKSLKVSIVIKALNEEERIEAAIVSALAAVECVGGEVILADSASTDRTVEIARRFPVRITQLQNPADRRCGAGPQLGFQEARGEFVYILDGDMELDPGFLVPALQAMEAEPQLAGVAGLVEEQSDASYQFRGRKRRRREAQAGAVEWLDMGGLYRASALRQTGYFSDRNLHCFEEMELGLRLSADGWKLCRLPIRSVLHHGYDEGNWRLLLRRWQTHYLDGAGEVLRAARGKPYFLRVVFSLKHLIVGLMLWVGALLSILLLPVSPLFVVAMIVAFVVLIGIRFARIGNLADACFGQVVWQVTSLAMVRGYFSPHLDPHQPLVSSVLAPGKAIEPNESMSR